MRIIEEIEIKRPKEDVWAVITDIEKAADFISAIRGIQILHQPKEGLVGLKWKEKRMMFGKEAEEVMWITEAVENAFYCTRAESHGSIYRTKLLLREAGESTVLSMDFSGEAQTLPVKILSFCMGFLIKPAMKKALMKDLEDIKEYLG